MYNHQCKKCGKVWYDHEHDTLCPRCWSGDYTTEYRDEWEQLNIDNFEENKLEVK